MNSIHLRPRSTVRNRRSEYRDRGAAQNRCSHWKTNDLAWEYGFPVLSSYVDRKKNRFLIITEADRSATTILLPEEY